MTARAVKFTQVQVARAVKGVASAGQTVIRVEIDAAGTIVIICAGAPASGDDRPEDWEARLRSATGWEK